MAQKSLSCSDDHELRKLVDHDHPELSVSRQCALLGLPRSTLYYRPTSVRTSTLRIMARIDALYLEDPCSGSRRMVDYLAREGIPTSRDRVRNLVRRMGLRAIFQKPRTMVEGEPYERFPCLVAIGDLFSKNVLSWKLSDSLETEFCLQALEMALESGWRPEILHSDQDCQFTSSFLPSGVNDVRGCICPVKGTRLKRVLDLFKRTFPFQVGSYSGNLGHSCTQAANRSSPCSSGVCGRKPTQRSRALVSAAVASTSPGCIG